MNTADHKFYATTIPHFLGYCEGAIGGGKSEAARIEGALGIPSGQSAFSVRMNQIEETLKHLKPIEGASALLALLDALEGEFRWAQEEEGGPDVPADPFTHNISSLSGKVRAAFFPQ